VSVSVGYKHAGCLNENGDLYMWGDNSDKVMGLGKKSPKFLQKPTIVPYF
jgi:alpha-tubulin suppressor-like RCC1 family protein